MADKKIDKQVKKMKKLINKTKLINLDLMERNFKIFEFFQTFPFLSSHLSLFYACFFSSFFQFQTVFYIQ